MKIATQETSPMKRSGVPAAAGKFALGRAQAHLVSVAEVTAGRPGRATAAFVRKHGLLTTRRAAL